MGSPFLIIERVGAKEDAAAMAKYLITTLVLAASALADDSSAYAAPQGGYAAPAAAYARAAAPLPRCLRCHHRCPALCSTPRRPLQRQGRTSGRSSASGFSLNKDMVDTAANLLYEAVSKYQSHWTSQQNLQIEVRHRNTSRLPTCCY